MRTFLIRLKHLLSETPFKIISGGILFSWAIQIISHIRIEDKELFEVVREEYDRLILTGIIGAVVFFFFYLAILKTGSIKTRTNLIDLLGNFNFYLLYIFLGGGSLDLFFIILGLIGALFLLASFTRLPSVFSKKDLSNVLIAVVIIAYFSVFEVLYEGQVHFFEITKAFGSLSFLAIPLLFLKRGQRLFMYFIIVILLIQALPPLYHLYTFGSKMPTSVYYAILESPKQEMAEYVSSKFSLQTASLILLFVLIPLTLTFFLKKEEPGTPKNIFGGIILGVLLIIYSFANKNIRNNILYGYYQNFKDYRLKIETFEHHMARRAGRNIGFDGLKDKNGDKPCTFILIIGESTGRDHMSLYDYFRQTNPELESIKNELFVFNDVISPHSHTQAVLEKVFTFANFESMKPLFEEGTLVELFKQAGFKTYWLSNQFFLGEQDYITGSIAKASDFNLFINNGELTSDRSYDERLLSPLDRSLADTARKKFIVVHLLGTHDKYSKRYPPAYNVFGKEHEKDIPANNKPFLNNDSWAKEKVNEYDNAVRYNDHIVYEIIRKAKAESKPAYVLYFSDHGEDVYDSRPYFSHQEKDATPFMFKIPFIVWFSPEYKAQWANRTDSIRFYLNRKYQTDDVIHSIIDISNLELKRFSTMKSIFNPAFKEEKRYMNSLDYDSILPNYETYAKEIRKP